jgi:hypothetical protein
MFNQWPVARVGHGLCDSAATPQPYDQIGGIANYDVGS